MIIQGNIVDIQNRKIIAGEILLENGFIKKITPLPEKTFDQFILPGFIDAHVHVESSMLIPSAFAKLAVIHGTVATVSDPHEIANVMGMEGVDFMIENGKKVPFHFCWGAPSCVPATVFETAGDALDADQVNELLQRKEVGYLSEMMNYPGVLFNDAEVYKKINFSKKNNKPVDGHAPGLTGDEAIKYINAGISTDHECFTYEEALFKLKHGMKILIREGSAAKNFEALILLLNDFPDKIMFCSDDKHPNDLMRGHINDLAKRAVSKGIDIFKILKAACINPAEHYNIGVGLLKEGDAADFIVVKDLTNFDVLKTFVKGNLVAENGKSFINDVPSVSINKFNTQRKVPQDFAVKTAGKKLKVIEALEGQLITKTLITNPKIENDYVVSNIGEDVLKICVVNRYSDAPPAMAFIKNFGLKKGALATSVAHDSHNIIAVGVNDEEICSAVNAIIESRGGLCAVNGSEKIILPLPVGGIMSHDEPEKIANAYEAVDAFAKQLGCTLHAPFMTLSFMALLVIPQLKLSDKGLFDGKSFQFVSLFEN